MTDIVERLRAEAADAERRHLSIRQRLCTEAADEIGRLLRVNYYDFQFKKEAAAEIERLEAEVKRYRGILTSLRVEWVD